MDGLKDLFTGTNIKLFLQKYCNIHELFSASFQSFKRLFVLGCDATNDDETGIKSNESTD